MNLPSVPYFCASCGSVARPLEPDRPRCTNDAGAPRKDTCDDDGMKVVPLNEAISESEWPKEVKQCALQVCQGSGTKMGLVTGRNQNIFILNTDSRPLEGYVAVFYRDLTIKTHRITCAKT